VTSTESFDGSPAYLAALEQDYDHFADDIPEQRRAEWHRRRQSCPVSYSSFHGGFALLTRYEDAYGALADTDTFSSASGAGIPRQPMALIPEDMDPPQHRKYRQLINPPLAPQQVALYEPWVREMTIGLLDALDGQNRFDVVERFARPLPQMVTLKLLGIPWDRLDLVARTTTLLSTAPRGNAEADQAGIELFTYLTQFVAEKRADDSSDDMAASLTHAEVDGELVPDDVVLSMLALLLFGGLHTTTGAIAGALVWLADHPEDLARVNADRSLIGSSIDEIIRFTSPSSHLGRVATKDVMIQGCPVHKGQTVMVSIGSGNHDPEKFEHAETLMLGRRANHHLGFGIGPHRCAGSHLAKLQLQVALEEFIGRYPSFRVEDHSLLHYAGGEVRSLDRVPLIVS
jgi:cytochrome P450